MVRGPVTSSLERGVVFPTFALNVVPVCSAVIESG